MTTHEPWRSEEIKEILKNDSDPFSKGNRLVHLYVDDRKKHLEKLIIPALEQGCFVVCDRYSLSTYAYQMAQGVSLELIRKLHAEVINPDLTFFVDVDYNVAKKRILARGEKLEKFEKDEEFTKNLINNYRRLVLGSGENISLLGEVVKVNGNNSIREVGDEIIKNLQDYL